MRKGKWDKKHYEGIEIRRKNSRTIGFGRISREVAKRADALGMKVIYTDIIGKAEGCDEYEFCSFDDVLKRSDYISLHVPFDKEKGATNRKRAIAMMKDGALPNQLC